MYDKKSQVLLGTMLFLLVLSIAATYYKMVVLRDFVVIDDLDEVELEEE